MFLGTYAPKLDDKGRLILPAKFVDDLAAGVVITRGQEHCLYVYSSREFESVLEKVSQGPVTSRETRDYQRALLSGASQEVPDKQHRVTIPTTLREYAGLDRDLIVIGGGNRAEIWDTTAWNSYYEEAESKYANRSEEVIPGLF